MTETTVEAVYEGGVFRPTGPVAVREGEHVRLNVGRRFSPDDLPRIKIERNLTPEHRAALQKIKDAKSLGEMFAAFDAASRFDPPLPENYDFEKALELNRGLIYQAASRATKSE